MDPIGDASKIRNLKSQLWSLKPLDRTLWPRVQDFFRRFSNRRWPVWDRKSMLVCSGMMRICNELAVKMDGTRILS